MNDKQENKVSTLFKVRSFFNEHLATLAASAPILTTRVADFNTDLDNIQTWDSEATEDITGAHIQKMALWDTMATKAVNVSAALTGWRLDNNDSDGAKKVKKTKTDISSARDTHALFLCEKIIEFAQDAGVALIPYGITAIKITELETAVDAFRAYIQKPGNDIADRVSAGVHVDNYIKKCDEHLVKIDNIMLAISEEHSFLYLSYRTNRLIDDETGGSSPTPPDVIITIPPMLYMQALEMPYNPLQKFKANNTHPSLVIQWGLSTGPGFFSSPPEALDPGSSTKLSSTLGENGNFLVFYNGTPEPITVEVTIVDL